MRRILLSMTCVVALLLTNAPLVFGECEVRFPPLVGAANTPGVAYDVVISGGYAYVADGGSGLQIVDVSNPAAPAVVGGVDTPDSAYDVAVAGGYAYVADQNSGLQIIDVSNPAAPAIVGSVDTPGRAYGVAVSGTYAYVADYTSGLHVIDISNPTAPVIAGTADTPSQAYGVAVSGAYAYVADYYSGLQVVDVSNPTVPAIVGAANTPSAAFGVAVSAGYAYVADGGSGLQVVDVSNPAAPQIVGSSDVLLRNAYDVAVSSGYAYIADVGQYASCLQIIDVSDPASPQVVGSADTPSPSPYGGYGVAVSGVYGYLAHGHDGIQIFDVSDPISPQVIGSIDTAGSTSDVAHSGSYAYVADGNQGLQVVDVSIPDSPTIVRTVDTPGSAMGVTVSGSYAYIADGPSGLQVIDISDPLTSHIVGTVDTPDLARDVAVSGLYAYVADSFSGLQVVDVSDSTNPVIVASVDTTGQAHDVAISGSYAYVADGGSTRLQIIEISDPATAHIVSSSSPLGFMPYGVAVSGTYAYAAIIANTGSPTYPGGLRVVDISNPLAPETLDMIGTGDSHKVIMHQNLLFVVTNVFRSGVVILDNSNPALPQILGSVYTEGGQGVAALDTFVYVASGAAGLQVVSLCPEAAHQTLYVDDDNTCPGTGTDADPYCEIGTALAVALDGDTIIVRDGTYVGPNNKNLDFVGKAITLRAENGPENCVIDCEGDGRGFYFNSGETPASVVEGFTITNGGNVPYGGGIHFGNSSSATIRNCVIRNNSASDWGGGIYSSNSSPIITQSVIRENYAGAGAGMFLDISSPQISSSIITANSAPGAGGGIACLFSCSPIVANCTISNNSSSYGGGGIACLNSSPTIINSILWGDSAPEGPEIGLGDVGFTSSLTISYSAVEGGEAAVLLEPGSTLIWGTGNTDSDPLFVYGPLGFYYLSQTAAGQAATSPCVDAGSDTAANLLLDTFTTRTDQALDTGTVDMGYHYPVLESFKPWEPLDGVALMCSDAPPTFRWTPGQNDLFRVQLSIDNFTSILTESPVLTGVTDWTMPADLWQLMPRTGMVMSWRVQGADSAVYPYVIETSEVRTFTKQTTGIGLLAPANGSLLTAPTMLEWEPGCNNMWQLQLSLNNFASIAWSSPYLYTPQYDLNAIWVSVPLDTDVSWRVRGAHTGEHELYIDMSEVWTFRKVSP